MQKSADFLVEIGTEELPPKDLQLLVTSFADQISKQLTEAMINFGTIKTFATPRRLAVIIENLAAQQPEQTISKRGPALTAAYDVNGAPTKAALGFATSCGVTMQQVTTQETDKGAWLFFEQRVAGKTTVELLPYFITHALSQLPIKKNMRWGTGEISFVRPIHWIIMLYGKDVVHANIMGINSGNLTHGHRIHAPKPFQISIPDGYEMQLETEGSVIVDFANRKQLIIDGVNKLASQANGTAVIDPDLLNMVTGLVENPVPLIATFNPDFLRVPKECLISSMQDHQKCFAIIDQHGELLPKFILVSNISSTDPQTVIYGNELVMNARLADAAFYYDKDQQQTLESRREQLKNVVYQKKLGSIYDKTERIAKLAVFLSETIRADSAQTERAAQLCKADLLTNMVYEFPELQGTMGHYYALHDKESHEIGLAIEEHYKPRFAQDTLPTGNMGICLALADRIDTLVGMFGIGNIPTGEKDPYGLRRQAIAILRIIIEKNIDIDLGYLFITAHNNYLEKADNATDQLVVFCYDRLKAWYLSNDVPAKTIEAVLAVTKLNYKQDAIKPLDFNSRINAVVKFQKLDAAANLAAANKRVQNILEKNSASINKNHLEISEALFDSQAEKTLYSALTEQEKTVTPLIKMQDYTAILNSLATLQDPIDDFFTNVMVMVEDEKVRDNRLKLLQRLRDLFLQVADVSLL